MGRFLNSFQLQIYWNKSYYIKQFNKL